MTDKIDTTEMIAKARAEHHRQRAMRAVEQFIRRWGNEDPEFAADFYSVVAEIHSDASAAVNETVRLVLTSHFARQPPMPLVMSKT